MAQSQGVLRKPRGKAQEPLAIDRDEVARVAYALYEQRGRTDGRDLDDWLSAERMVKPQRLREQSVRHF